MSSKIKNNFLQLPYNLSHELDIQVRDMHTDRLQLVPNVSKRFPYAPEMRDSHPALNLYHVNQIVGERPLSQFDDAYADMARKKAVLKDIENRVSTRISEEAKAESLHINHQLSVAQTHQMAANNAALNRGLKMVHNRREIVAMRKKPELSSASLPNRTTVPNSSLNGAMNTIPIDNRQLAFAGGMAAYSPGLISQIKGVDLGKINFSFPEGGQNIKNTLGINAYQSASVINIKKVS